MHTCIDLGLLGKKSKTGEVVETAASQRGVASSASRATSSTSRPAKETQSGGKNAGIQIKKNFQSSMFHAFCVYAALENMSRQWIIAIVTSPLHRWCSDMNKRCRPLPDGARWQTEQCDGGFSLHVMETLEMVHSPTHLASWGLDIDFDDGDEHILEGARTSQQDEFADHVGRLATALASSRLHWGADFVEGWPRRSCLLVDLVPHNKQSEVIQQFRDHLATIERAGQSTSKKCREWAARSHMHLTPVLQIKVILKRSHWAPGTAPAFFSEAGASLLGTQLIEDGVKIAKKSAKGSSTGRISNDNAFHSLFTKGVLGDVHRFGEPQQTIVSAPCRGTSLATSAYVPQKSSNWTDLDAIKGTGEPSWYGPKGEDINMTIGDTKTLDVCMLEQKEHDLPKMVVMSGLLDCGPALVRKKSGPLVWYFLLGRLSPTCFFGAQASIHRYGGTSDEYLLFDVWDNNSKFLILASIDDWEAMEFMWVSPYHQWIKWRTSPGVAPARNCIRAIPKGRPCSLLEFGAKQAFGSQTKSWMVELARLVVCEVDATYGIFEVVWSLVQFVLKTSDEDTLNIAEARAVKSSKTSAKLNHLEQIEGFADNFTKDEMQEVKKADGGRGAQAPGQGDLQGGLQCEEAGRRGGQGEGEEDRQARQGEAGGLVLAPEDSELGPTGGH